MNFKVYVDNFEFSAKLTRIIWSLHLILIHPWRSLDLAWAMFSDVTRSIELLKHLSFWFILFLVYQPCFYSSFYLRFNTADFMPRFNDLSLTLLCHPSIYVDVEEEAKTWKIFTAGSPPCFPPELRDLALPSPSSSWWIQPQLGLTQKLNKIL